MHVIVIKSKVAEGIGCDKNGDLYTIKRPIHLVRYQDSSVGWIRDGALHSEHITFGYSSNYVSSSKKEKIINAF